jgi:hypothetical protein
MVKADHVLRFDGVGRAGIDPDFGHFNLHGPAKAG